jgi:hypothetical protein
MAQAMDGAARALVLRAFAAGVDAAAGANGRVGMLARGLAAMARALADDHAVGLAAPPGFEGRLNTLLAIADAVGSLLRDPAPTLH